MPQTEEPKVRHHLVFPYRENEVPHASWHVAENKVPQGAAAPPREGDRGTPATQLSLPITFLGTAKVDDVS